MKVFFSKTKTIKILLIVCISGGVYVTQSCKQKSLIKNIDQEVMINVPESELYVRVRGNK